MHVDIVSIVNDSKTIVIHCKLQYTTFYCAFTIVNSHKDVVNYSELCSP